MTYPRKLRTQFGEGFAGSVADVVAAVAVAVFGKLDFVPFGPVSAWFGWVALGWWAGVFGAAVALRSPERLGFVEVVVWPVEHVVSSPR